MQVASINVEDARTLAVSPWDKSMVQVIEKAIMKSDLGSDAGDRRPGDPDPVAAAHGGAPPGTHEGRARGGGERAR